MESERQNKRIFRLKRACLPQARWNNVYQITGTSAVTKPINLAAKRVTARAAAGTRSQETGQQPEQGKSGQNDGSQDSSGQDNGSQHNVGGDSVGRDNGGRDNVGHDKRFALAPIGGSESFKRKAYAALKSVIVSMDIYRSRTDIRLDERALAQEFGISRTPVREALAQLEREGFVRSVPRRGIYITRKNKREVIEMITAWAALESMAARLITQSAASDDIAMLRQMFVSFGAAVEHAKIDEYSEVNIDFHQAIIRMSGNQVLIDLAENLFTHMRMIRRKTIVEKDRIARSIRDHMQIIAALEARDATHAEQLVRDHALGLAEHVEKYADYLD